jgi:hypothetical protein
LTGTKGSTIVQILKVLLIVIVAGVAITMIAVGTADLVKEPQLEEIEVDTGAGDSVPPVMIEDPPQEQPTPDMTEPPSTFTNEQPVVFDAAGSLEGDYSYYNGVVFQCPVDWAMVDYYVADAHAKADQGCPAMLNHMLNTGRQLWNMYMGLPYDLHPINATLAAACEVIYEGHVWEDVFSYYAPTSPWRWRGEWVVRNLLPYGFEWEFAAAALYAESSWGCNTSAVAFGNAATLQGYINLISTYPAPNDINSFVNEWHMPANIETFRHNFGFMVEAMRTWIPE